MTAVQWLIKKISEPVLMINWYRNELYEKAKEMEKQQMIISDEDIEKEANENSINYKQRYMSSRSFIDGAKWYREQLKSRQ
jgi:hypothetical protein